MFYSDNLFSCALTEQIARHIFEAITETDMVMVFVDKFGSHWPSDSEKFNSLNMSKSTLEDICGRIDDGEGLLTMNLNGYCIFAEQLVTEKTRYGYIIAAVDGSVEDMKDKFSLMEAILAFANLTATLVEKNNMLYEMQLKHQHLICKVPVTN
ncbi:MAG: hypothetical protein PHF37_08145 [Phycisphaerae bacterium]|nr:hypothetical protein [Phycisphaerae bacterium]